MLFRNKLAKFFKIYLIFFLILSTNISILQNSVNAASQGEGKEQVNASSQGEGKEQVNASSQGEGQENVNEKLEISQPEKGSNEIKNTKDLQKTDKESLKNSKEELKTKEKDEKEVDDKSKKELSKEKVNIETPEKDRLAPNAANIYPWLPSMINIFNGQTIQGTQDLKPFGYELFRQGSTVFTPNMDVTVGSDYILGPGDNLEINIWGGVNTSLSVTVDRDGKIVLPEVGTFYVTGKNFGSLKEQLRQKLAEIFNNVSVDVSMGKLRKLKVYVVGETRNPGAFDITSVTTLFNVLFMAGGPTEIGSLRNIDIIRKNKVIKTVDLYNFILRGDKSGDVRLENGDTIYFNLKGKTVGIQGLVIRPAIYELKKENKLTDLINLAGGVVPTSYLKNVQVKRVVANKEIIILNVDMTSKAKLVQFNVKDKDLINIFPILSIDRKTIYLNGHVFRPGTYEYRNNMKLSNLIKSYNDLLPEPYLDYAEIIRLQQPDLKPYMINFNLGDVLNRKKDLDLKPFDTVIIYSKWNLTRIPEVEVTGEIFRPGKYQIIQGTKLKDIISIAGGVTRTTYLDRVDLIRRRPGSNDIKQNISLSLKEVLKDNSKDNIEIKDRDLIIFHNIGDIFPEEFVSIAGEVTKPNTFPLGKGMRIKDLFNLGGSLTKAAYTKEAELVRYIMDGTNVKFTIIKIDLQKALAGDLLHNIALQDLDRLLIKQVPQWKDIGTTIELQGQVKYPGSYAVSPNDRLSDVIERAGGFLDNAYLKGSVFYRQSVKEIQKANLEKLISDLDDSISLDSQVSEETLKNMSVEALAARERKLNYRKKLLEKLKVSEVTGRMIIELNELNKFKNSDNNVKIVQGDILSIPKKPDFISVQGEVYNQTAIVYKTNKPMEYYLDQAGGATQDADKGRIYIIKANGSVISGGGKWFYDIHNEILEPGDTILVPQVVEKTDYLETLRSVIDIAYKTAVSAGVIVTASKTISGN